MAACAALGGIGLITLAVPTIIGVAAVGPVAGGFFATAQGLGWVGAGTVLAGVQSAVMAGTVNIVGSTIVGSAAACFAADEILHKDGGSGDGK